MCSPKYQGGLGFKKLNVFNLALHAKQGWHIHQLEESLLHRLYKAHYFLETSFFESHLDSNLSYAWRGIWESKKWLEKGCIWHIGDYKMMNIWIDSWILGLALSLQPPSWADLDIQRALVEHIIDPSTNNWHMLTILSFFNPIIVANIQKIPLSPSQHADKLILNEERNDKFSV